MTNLLSRLDETQKQAVLHEGGPMVVFAGAGSGKTRVITTRIASLIGRGVPPWEILALTFTNKAAAEMRQRVIEITGQGQRTLITTFHSACARWLREFSSELGYGSDFSIFDDTDTNSALKKVIREIYPGAEVPTVLADMKRFLNQVKTHALMPQDCANMAESMGIIVPPGAIKMYQAYQTLLHKCNAMDFGDLIMNMLLLLRNHSNVRGILQDRYQHILVDEYQDTSRTQIELVQLLAMSHKNLVVVGDDDQSIYSWRGASTQNILDFSRDFPDAHVVTLGQNYRSTSNIVAAASQMISSNASRAEKRLFSTKPPGDLIEYRRETSQETESWWVAKQIQAERPRFGYDEVAVFYRTNSQSRSLEEALRRENIPYTVYGSLEFYDRLEVKDLISYMRFLMNPRDEISLLRIINTPNRGLGDKAIDSLVTKAREGGSSLYDTIKNEAGASGRIGPKLRYFVDLVDALQRDLAQTPLGNVVPLLLEALEYPEYLKKKFPDQVDDKMGNVYELAASMHDFTARTESPTLSLWLQSITLVRDVRDPEHDSVSLMTLHMAKGLEFERVYIVGVEDGILPHRNSVQEKRLLEEERRLFYVGMTRAKMKLSLTCANERRNYQTTMMNDPSRFLRELPRDLIQTLTDTDPVEPIMAPQSGDDTYVYAPLKENAAKSLEPGALVFHPTYGRGQVEEVDDEFGVVRVVVRFFESGLKRIRPSQLDLVAEHGD